MAYAVAILLDPHRNTFKIVDLAGSYVEAWQRAAAARQLMPDRIFFVLGAETREDPKPCHSKPPSNGPIRRDGRA